MDKLIFLITFLVIFSLTVATFLLGNTNYIKQNISCPMLIQVDLMSAINVEHLDKQTINHIEYTNLVNTLE